MTSGSPAHHGAGRAGWHWPRTAEPAGGSARPPHPDPRPGQRPGQRPGHRPGPGPLRAPLRPARTSSLLGAAIVTAVAATAGLAAVGAVPPAWVVTGGAVAAVPLLVAVALLSRQAAARSDQLAAARRSFDSLAVTTHELLWRTDATGRLTWTNDVTRELLGYGPEDLLGRQVSTLLDPDQLPLWRRQIRAFIASGGSWRDVPHRVLHRDGRAVLVEASGQPVVDRHGLVVGYQGTLRRVDRPGAEAERLAHERQLVSSLLCPEAVRIAFQPIVSLSTDEVVGAEALTRFITTPHLPDLPALPPSTWFARAWEVGLGVALELQSLRAALAALPQLPADLYVSVNAAPRTVLDPTFRELLTDPSTPIDRLVLEITEHESIDDYELLLSVLRPTRRRGLRLAVDDAGAGYASFRHIVKLRPDHIKLDRDLTAGIEADPARRALASAVVVFALELDASVTAEGVETPEQLDMLRSLSVDAAQGFYLGRPVCDPQQWRTWRADAPAERGAGSG
ncbi:MAG: EAL domain-containing protein [Frankiaceae bacterium]